MATIYPDSTCGVDHAISSDGVCNMDFLNAQLINIFETRLNDAAAPEIEDDVLESFLDVMPEGILSDLLTISSRSFHVAAAAAPSQADEGTSAGAGAAETVAPAAAEAPAAEESKLEQSDTLLEPPAQVPQASFSQGGFQEPGSEPQFNSGGFSAGEAQPPPVSTGFTSGDGTGFSGDVPSGNYGEGDQNSDLPPPDPNVNQTQGGFQPPKWASLLLPVTTDLRSGLPQNFRIPIKIGDVSFEPMLDTGSSLLWVPAKVSSSDQVPPNFPHYRPAKKGGRMPPVQEINYAGGKVKYRPCVDQISMADTVYAYLFPFGGAVGIKPDNETAYGILGLSPQVPRVWKDGKLLNKTFNLIWTLDYAGELKGSKVTFIGPNSYSDPVSAANQTDKQRSRGYLAVGSLHDDLYAGDMAWCSLLRNDKWMINLEEVRVNGQALPSRKRRALIDTGMSYLAAPSDDFDEIVKILPNATLPTTEDKNFFFVAADDLQTVTFKLGGKVLGLRQEDLYIGKASAGSDKVVGSIVRKPQQYGSEEDVEYWVLGGIFLDNVVTSFMIGDDEFLKSHIGFAEIADIDYANWKPGPADPFYMGSRHNATLDGVSFGNTFY